MRRSASRRWSALACESASVRSSVLYRLEGLEYRDALALCHLDDRLLPGARASARSAAALWLALDADRPHLHHFYVEHDLNRLRHLGAMSVRVHAEGVLAGGGEHIGLL